MVDRLNTAVLDQLTAPDGPLHNADAGSFAGATWRVGQRAGVRRNFTDAFDRSMSVRNGTVQPSFAESPNEYLLDQLNRLNQPGHDRPGPDHGIGR